MESIILLMREFINRRVLYIYAFPYFEKTGIAQKSWRGYSMKKRAVLVMKIGNVTCTHPFYRKKERLDSMY